MMRTSKLFVDLNAATMCKNQNAYGMIENAAIAITDGMIAWVGPVAELPTAFASLPREGFGGRTVTPGLSGLPHPYCVMEVIVPVEFEMRLQGASIRRDWRALGAEFSPR